MRWFIKTEKFRPETIKLSQKSRHYYLDKHKTWVNKLRENGIKIHSGYIVNKNLEPGGGGLLFFQAESYEKAEELIKHDPMIEEKLVTWELKEWIPFCSDLIS